MWGPLERIDIEFALPYAVYRHQRFLIESFMLITCTGCDSKMRVPDTAAGKRVKCPKCAAIVRVPETPPVAEVEETTGVSSAPLPPVPTPPPIEPEPPPVSGTEVTPTSSSTPKKPPPIEDDEPPRRRRRYDDDDDVDDDDDLDIRDRRGRGQSSTADGMAVTSMILGITAASMSLISCTCCGVPGILAMICATLALIFGLMCKAPGNEVYTRTGIICACVAFLFVMLWFVGIVIFVGLDAALNKGMH